MNTSTTTTPHAKAYSRKPYKFSAILLAAMMSIPASTALATTYYWDVNGSGTSGFGTVVGTWDGTNAFFNTSSTGTTGGTVTANIGSGDDLIIKQATTNTGSLTVSGAQSASSITFAANVGPTTTITGGSLMIGGTGASSGIFQQSSGANTISTGLTLNSANTAFSFSNSGAGLLTIGGGVTGAATTGTQTITVGSSSTGGITLGGIIGNGSGGGNVAVAINNSSTGVTTINGASTFSGGTTISSGTVRIGANSAAAGGTISSGALGVGEVTLNNGVTIYNTPGITMFHSKFNILGDIQVGLDSTSGRTVWGGTLDLGGGTRVLTLTKATTLAALTSGLEALKLSAITGGATPIVQNGTLSLATTNTGSNYSIFRDDATTNFSGNAGLIIGDHVVTTWGTSTPFGSGSNAPSVTVNSGGIFNTSDGGSNSRNVEIYSLSGSGSVTNLSTASGTSTVTINNGNAKIFSGAITNGANGSIAITKTGAGTQILSGSGLNTYSGATIVNGGVFGLGANNAFSANSAITLTSGTIDLASFSTSAASLDFKGGQTISIDLGTAENSTALLALSGNFTKNSTGVFNFDLNGGQVGTYKLISFAGTTTFTSGSEFTALLDLGYAGNFTLNANDLSFTITTAAVPEPSTYAAFAGAAILGFSVLRRRRSV